MIDLSIEKTITLAEVAKMLPPARNGRPVSVSCVVRWITRGTKANGGMVRLEAIRLGSRWLSNKEAVQRFAEAQTPRFDGQAIPPRTAARRQRAAERAARLLEKMGV